MDVISHGPEDANIRRFGLGGEGMVVDIDRRRLAGAAWLASGLTYGVTEALSASRFTPRYSYAHNFISELGVSDCGVAAHGWNACSPLHGLMNAGFIAEGLLFIVAVGVVFNLLSSRSRYAFAVLAVAHGVGLILVGLFHGGGSAFVNGAIAYHVLGATLAIIGGNLAILVSSAPREFGAPRAIKLLSKTAPVAGILAVVILAIGAARHAILLLDYGAWERLSVYTILGWEAVFGSWLLLGRR